MTAIFSPYHNFSNYGLFKSAFNDLKSLGRVAASALGLPRYYKSSTIKLNSAKYHLNTLLSYETVFISPPLSTSGATSVTVSTATNVSALTDFDISRELDNLFTNLSSAFNLFAQVINLVYLIPPLSDDVVSFYNVLNVMADTLPNETLTQYLLSLQTEQWYKDMKDFRRCTTHRKAIEFFIDMSRRFMEASWQTRILLPDNPFSTQPTYSLNREMKGFCEDLLRNSLNAIDHMYGLMEAKIRVANQIPV